MNARSRRRAGRHARKLVRGDIRAAVRQHRGLLARFLVVWVAIGIAVVAGLVVIGQSHQAAFFAGLLAGVTPIFWLYFLIGQGFAHRQMGGDAEAWTAEALSKLDDRVWRVYHDVPLRYGNVDHVVVGPGRVYAVETKWSGARGETRFLEGGARQAARNAEELKAILGARGCRREVIPLLVVWGGGVADALGEAPDLWGSTRVVAGHHSEVWLDRIRKASDRLELDWPAQQVIEQMIVAGHADPVDASPPSVS